MPVNKIFVLVRYVIKILKIILIQKLNKPLCFGFLTFDERIRIYPVKHELPKFHHGFRYFIGHTDIVPALGIPDNVMRKAVKSLGRGIPEGVAKLLRDIVFTKDLPAYCIIHVMMDICDLIGKSDDLAFKRRRRAFGLVV